MTARYGLLVKDIGILASTQGADWWLTFRGHFEPVGRVVPIPGTASPQGDWAWVKCGDPDDGSDSREEAAWLRDHMVKQGVPQSAVAVRREPADLASLHGPRTPKREVARWAPEAF